MLNEELQVRVQCLEQKIMQLLGHCKGQQEMIQQLRQEKERLLQQVTNRAETVHKLSDSLALGTITKNENRTRDWEARIDSYISDIDNSIAYLEKLQ